ncbi:MAG TPA: NADPH:quinone oxidoreductase family protein [Sporichthyaceae bacterium]|jgi:NADPH2:quinone reductase|nr:NADPH:quinone oxidoreductase family protein [Sporichthyaceae bacterium]
MRAWQVTGAGEPRAVLKLGEVDQPTAGPGQVLVRVRATAANFPDVLMCRGMYQERPELPFTPGVEVCGDVVEVGPGVTEAVPGQRVIGAALLPHGGFADYAVLDARFTFPAPAALDDAEAGGFLIAYHTGWFALHRRTSLSPGETLLVHAAAGGVGSAAVQLGKAAGARVIAVVGGADKAKVARDLGADVVVDRRTEDVVAAVKDATGGRGVDVVYDPVGGSAYTQSTKCIAFEGRILVIGFAGGEVPQAALNHVLIKNYSVIGLHWGLYRERDPGAITVCQAALAELATAGKLKPLVGQRLALADVADGLQHLADGTTVGRVTFVAGGG